VRGLQAVVLALDLLNSAQAELPCRQRETHAIIKMDKGKKKCRGSARVVMKEDKMRKKRETEDWGVEMGFSWGEKSESV
jgi:hypothetical protein